MEAVRVKPESWIQDIISYSAENAREDGRSVRGRL